MSMSTRAHKFGRQQQTNFDAAEDEDGEGSGYGAVGGYTAAVGTGDDGEFGGYYDDDSDEYDYEDEEDDEESVEYSFDSNCTFVVSFTCLNSHLKISLFLSRKVSYH